jgi:hypothetical protein
MATKNELENQVDQLSKKLDEMVEAFRAVFMKTDQNLSFIQDIKKELEGVKVDIANMKSGKTKAPENVDYGTTVQRHQ